MRHAHARPHLVTVAVCLLVVLLAVGSSALPPSRRLAAKSAAGALEANQQQRQEQKHEVEVAATMLVETATQMQSAAAAGVEFTELDIVDHVKDMVARGIYAAAHAVWPAGVPITAPGPDAEDQAVLPNHGYGGQQGGQHGNKMDLTMAEVAAKAKARAQHEQAQSAAAAATVYPGQPMAVAAGMGLVTAAAARAAIRGAADAVFVHFNLYNFDGAGRVIGANFNVAGPMVLAANNQRNEWCDVAWNEGRLPAMIAPAFFTEGDAQSRNRLEWQAGHIIADAMGGHPFDPINFFPMHHISNLHGRYYRAELIAAAVRAYIIGRGVTPGAAVRVNIVLNYNFLGRPFVPSGGTYSISVSGYAWQRNFDAVFCGANGIALPAPGARATVFLNRAVPAPAGRRRLQVTWSNLHGDRPIQFALAPAPPLATHADFVVDPSTF